MVTRTEEHDNKARSHVKLCCQCLRRRLKVGQTETTCLIEPLQRAEIDIRVSSPAKVTSICHSSFDTSRILQSSGRKHDSEFSESGDQYSKQEPNNLTLLCPPLTLPTAVWICSHLGLLTRRAGVTAYAVLRSNVINPLLTTNTANPQLPTSEAQILSLRPKVPTSPTTGTLLHHKLRIIHSSAGYVDPHVSHSRTRREPDSSDGL